MKYAISEHLNGNETPSAVEGIKAIFDNSTDEQLTKLLHKLIDSIEVRDLLTNEKSLYNALCSWYSANHKEY